MTPFAKWFSARAAGEARHDENDVPPEYCVMMNDTQGEMTGLLDAILENLLTSSVLGLRTTLNMASVQASEVQVCSQRNAFLDGIAEAEARITDAVANALMPVLSEHLLQQAIKEFSALIKTLLPEFDGQAVVIRAPSEIKTILDEALKREALEADIMNSDDGNISVQGGQFKVSVVLNDWSLKLKGALAA
jgi:hypothetical protein